MADPKNVGFKYDVSIYYARMGDLLADSEPKQSLEFYTKAMDINEKLLTNAPNEFRFLSRKALYTRNLSNPLQKLGRQQEALTRLRQSLEMLQVMRKMNPTNDETYAIMHGSLNTLADPLLESKDLIGAFKNYRQALDIAQKEIATNAEDLYALWRLADSYTSLGKYYAAIASEPKTSPNRRIANWQEARSWYQKSFEIWNNWNRQAVSTAFDTSRKHQAAQAVSRCNDQLAKL